MTDYSQDVFITKDGPKRVRDMTREELIVALTNTIRVMESERKRHRRDLDSLAGKGQSRTLT